MDSNDPHYPEHPLAAQPDTRFKSDRIQFAEEPMKTFSTGARRSVQVQARFDLIPSHALERLALRYALGASKYGEWNWRRGFPLSDLLNHIVVHMNAYRDRFVATKRLHPTLSDEQICSIVECETVDDDLAGAAWGFFTIMELERTGKLS